MDMEIDSEPIQGGDNDGEPKSKQIIVMLIGAPGSGKSTFCENIIRGSSRPWVRICQDIVNNGKSGTKLQCLTSATSALKEGKNIFVDRCNLEKEQRSDFIKLGGSQFDLHAVVLDLPAKLCISRCAKRTDHEGKLQGGKAAAVVNRMLQKKELPKLSEGYCRITYCQNESDVQDAVNTYTTLGLADILPSGYFGHKSQNAKVQVGIMKFLKKLDCPSNSTTDANTKSSPPNQMENKEHTYLDEFVHTSSVSPTPKKTKEGEFMEEEPVGIGVPDQMENKERKDLERFKKNSSDSTIPQTTKEGEAIKKEPVSVAVVPSEVASGDTLGLPDTPTLAFPSISTADFQFDHEKASEIIIEKVQECLDNHENIKLVLVDLTHRSRILSLVKTKAAAKNIDSDRFHTFVGDITRLHSEGGLRCNVIANAANWRLKPGGGGVNAAIHSAAGPALEDATKKRAGTLAPGKAVVVPLPSSSPLYSREGVTHVIHVLGPNMNPQRPYHLNGNYAEGCRILQDAYSSLFKGFISVVREHSTVLKKNKKPHSAGSETDNHNGTKQADHISSDSMLKNEDTYEAGRAKKCKSENEIGTSKAWGSWAQALYNIAVHPEKHKSVTYEVTDDLVILNDAYPKAKKHILVLARLEGLDRLADVRQEHIQLLRTMHDLGINWTKKFIQEDASLVFRLGYHSVPSMRQLHLHVISQDFDSPHLKNKKHWNSFNSAFFLDSVDVIEEVSKNGKVCIRGDDSLLSMELRCHRCRSAHPNIPRLKSHIKNCRAPFPSKLLEGGRLIQAPN